MTFLESALKIIVAGRSDQSVLNMYVVYENPRDFPGEYIVRRHIVTMNGDLPTEQGWRTQSLESARLPLQKAGLMMFTRHENDDPVIKEVWL